MRRPSLTPSIIAEPLEARRLLAAINSGQIVTGSINSDGETDSYTINVTAGAPLLVAVHRDESAGSTLTPQVLVLAPNGTTLLDRGGASGGGVGALIPANSTGTYEVRVTADAELGAYKIAVFRPTTNTNEADLVAADSGRRFAGTVSSGDLDFYTIDATARETIGVTVTENDAGVALDPRAWLVSEDGRVIGGDSDEEGVRVDDRARNLGETRYWAVVADGGDDDTGIYGITVTRVPGTQYAGDPDTAPLASGATRTGNLPGGDVDVFQIPVSGTGTMELTATLDHTGGTSLNPDLVLYDNSGATVLRGERVNGGGTSLISTAVNPSAGPYWIVARDYEADDGGTFSFTYTLSVPPSAVMLDGNVLRISGTEAADTISVSRATTDGVRQVAVNYRGATSFYDADAVASIYVDAGAGNDTVSISPALTLTSYVLGGSGDDTLRGGGGTDSLVGGAGRNRLYGGDGTDSLRGSNGRDFLFGEGGDDLLSGAAGNDYLDGGGNKDRLFGGGGDDSLLGGNGNDQLYAEQGNDTLSGGGGDDNLDGGSGIDRVESRQAGDRLISIESV